MILVFIHGISDDRDAAWAGRWRVMIRPLIDADVVDVVSVSWEKIHETKYNSARSHRENLLQDLGALTNQQVHAHLHQKLQALENKDQPIWIVAHSLGSALAYQALDYLQYGRAPGLFVERLITVGCPLWIPYSRITKRLTSLNVVMPLSSKLTNVGHWVNVAGRIDPVAGFGIVKIPPADRHITCLSSHSMRCYVGTEGFWEAFRR